MPNKKILWLLIILLIIVMVIFFINQLKQTAKLREYKNLQKFFADLDQQTPLLKKENPKKGNEGAGLVIYEFNDFLCPYCAEMKKVLDEVMKKYNNQILLVWKDFPRLAESEKAAIAARCANEQGNFWAYHDLLFQNQNKLKEEYYIQAAGLLKLDLEKFQSCLINPEITKLVENDLTEGFLLKVDATPYFFVGQERISGYVNYNQLAQIIEQQLLLNK